MSRGIVVVASSRAGKPSRRAAQRESTLLEIRREGRRRLVSEGEAGVTLRPIARALGLTAPALYRYYASRDDLLLDLIADLYAELTEGMERASAGPLPQDLAARTVAVTWEFRRWARANPREFQLVFATPVGTGEDNRTERLDACGQRFGRVYQTLFAEIWQRAPFPIPADDDLDPRLRAQLATWAADNDIPLPLGALAMFLACWVRIYGLISLEVFGHLGFALEDVTPMYDAMMAELGARLGLPWRAEFGCPEPG